MADHPHMKKPEKGKKPEKIKTPGKPGDSGPGGAHPGRNRPKTIPELAAESMKEHDRGTSRSR
jgi:hypothetical protein